MNTISPKKIMAFGALAFSLVFTGCLTDDKGEEGNGPTISVSPADQIVNAGSTATFTVIAAGEAPLTYQWMRNGNNIEGATSATYTFAASNTDDNAEYKVKVSDKNGSTTSTGGFLRIRVTSKNITLGAQSSASSSSLDLDTWQSYNATQAKANSNIIDLVFAFSTANDSSALYSPNVAKSGVGGTAGFDFMQDWTTTNTTEMRLVNTDFNAVNTSADIKALFDQGNAPSTTGRVFLKETTQVVAKSNSGLYVLIDVGTVVHSASGVATFSGKAKW
jgi:hypothetical protein